MKKLTYIKALSALFLGLTLASCDQDVSVPDIPRDNSTLAVISEDGINVREGQNTSFTIVQENLIDVKFDGKEFFDNVSGQIGIRVIGGTAVEGEDFRFNIPTIQQVSPFLLQDGYYLGYDASVNLVNVANNVITAIADGEAEGSETIILQFFPAGIGGVVIDDTLTVRITD